MTGKQSGTTGNLAPWKACRFCRGATPRHFSRASAGEVALPCMQHQRPAAGGQGFGESRVPLRNSRYRSEISLKVSTRERTQCPGGQSYYCDQYTGSCLAGKSCPKGSATHREPRKGHDPVGSRREIGSLRGKLLEGGRLRKERRPTAKPESDLRGKGLDPYRGANASPKAKADPVKMAAVRDFADAP